MLLFYMFQDNQKIPEFTPDMSDTRHGEFGRRDWYQTLLFQTKHPSKPMTYTGMFVKNTSSLLFSIDFSMIRNLALSLAHYNFTVKMHEACNIAISKVTHADRVSSGTDMGLANVEEGERKAQGLWNRDTFQACYSTGVPTQGVLALAGADPYGARHTYKAVRFGIGNCNSISLCDLLFEYIDLFFRCTRRHQKSFLRFFS